MARWIFNRPVECSDPHERRVAELLKKLGKGWTIRWGFYYRDNAGVLREGDFLIFGPDCGLLVLEVKGDRFRAFGPTGRWEGDPTTNRDHPLYQLDQEHAAVIRELEENDPTWHPVAKAICLPNDCIPEGQKTWHGLPREVFIDRKDLSRFFPAFQRCFERPVPSEKLERHRRAFLKVYAKGTSPEEVHAFIDQNEAIFRRQFTASYGILDLVSGNRQLLVEGRSGSGKTWHAIETARRFAQAEGADSGKEVLVLCYNLALGRLLTDLVARQPLERGRITVFRWEDLAESILKACGLPWEPPGPETDKAAKMDFYDVQLPGLLLECIRDPALAERLPKYDALVVDEAQDHDTAFASALGEQDSGLCGWWTIYWSLIRESTAAPMAFFYDPGQRPPFRGGEGFQPGELMRRLSQPAHVRLPQVLRYTRPIFRFLLGLNSAGTHDLLHEMGQVDDLPEGPEVEFYERGDSDESVTALVEGVLNDWEQRGYCRPCDVLVLHFRSDLAASPLGLCESLAGYRLVDYLVPAEDAGKKERIIRHTSINKAKGLDAIGVIMVGLPPFPQLTHPDQQFAYFMGASRAKQLLAVIHG